MKLSKRLLSPLAYLVLVVALLAACGGRQATQAPIAPSPTIAAPAPTPTPSPRPIPTTAETQTIDGNAAFRHVLALADDIGPRPAGEEGERRAAEYIARQLRSYGYTAETQEFQFGRERDRSTLEVTSPQRLILNAPALANSSQGTVSMELVAAGLGRRSDFPSSGLDGRIALVQRGELTFTDKVNNAAAAGAGGIIVYNNAPGQFRGVIMGRSHIPAVGIPQEQGGELLRLLTTGPVVASITVRIDAIKVTSHNVVGRPPGGRCRVIVGGHYDSVDIAPGGNDNASGVGAMLEIARVAAASGVAEGGACFVAFGAEEEGLLGSRHFVASIAAEGKDFIRGMINLDVVGAGSRWQFVGSSPLVDLAIARAERLGVRADRGSLPFGVGSDHQSFIAAGIPAVFITTVGGPPIHTPQDTAAIVQPELLAQAAQIGFHVLQELLKPVG